MRSIRDRGNLRSAGVPAPDPAVEIKRLLASVAAQPERCHVIGAYALGKAQRVIKLIREAEP